MPKPLLSIVNGTRSALIDTQSRGLAFGDGVFETMRVTQGKIPLQGYHTQRLLHGVNALGLSFSESELQQSFRHFLSEINQVGVISGRAKCIVARRAGGQGVIPTQPSEVDVVFLYYQLGAQPNDADLLWSQSPLELLVSNTRLPLNANLAGLKHLNRLDYVLAAQRSPLTPSQQLLLLDTEGHVIETLHHNVFFLVGSQIITPRLDLSGVEGVFKAFLKQVVAPELALEWLEKDIALGALGTFDGCFITNAFTGITPVKSIKVADAKACSSSGQEGVEKGVSHTISFAPSDIIHRITKCVAEKMAKELPKSQWGA